MKIRFILLILVVCLSFGTKAQTPPCQRIEAHQFDFWIGEWNVYKNGTDTLVGHSKITSIAGGCGILESYTNASKTYTGNSINQYNFFSKKWMQTWIDNTGLTLELEGSYDENKMILLGEIPNLSAGGSKIINKITWFNNSDGTVRQLWEQSQDEGKNFVKAFDGLYKKIK